MHRLILLILVPFILFSCVKPTELKTVDWNGNTITWSVMDGGATTSFYWKIYFNQKGNKYKNLIFESYSLPYIKNISIKNNDLLIHCSGLLNNNELIIINLNQIDYFVNNPIRYDYYNLKQSNEFYYEPNFIKEERESRNKMNNEN